MSIKRFRPGSPAHQIALAVEYAIHSGIQRIFFWISIGVLAFGISFFVLEGERDSTDGPDKRSNMRLHTDAMTGCQYLSAPGGGITPRMGADGKQICQP